MQTGGDVWIGTVVVSIIGVIMEAATLIHFIVTGHFWWA